MVKSPDEDLIDLDKEAKKLRAGPLAEKINELVGEYVSAPHEHNFSRVQVLFEEYARRVVNQNVGEGENFLRTQLIEMLEDPESMQKMLRGLLDRPDLNPYKASDFLARAVKNKIIDARRKVGRISDISLDTAYPALKPGGSSNWEEVVPDLKSLNAAPYAAEMVRQVVLKAAESMSTDMVRTMKLLFQGRTRNQIANEFGIPAGTVAGRRDVIGKKIKAVAKRKGMDIEDIEAAIAGGDFSVVGDLDVLIRKKESAQQPDKKSIPQESFAQAEAGLQHIAANDPVTQGSGQEGDSIKRKERKFPVADGSSPDSGETIKLDAGKAEYPAPKYPDYQARGVEPTTGYTFEFKGEGAGRGLRERIERMKALPSRGKTQIE